MDPIIRAVSDVRSLRSACDPFNKEALTDYFCKMGEEMGFSVVKNPRKGIAKVLCLWKDGKNVYLAVDASYGNEKEILGALFSLSAFQPHVGVLVTASKVFWGVSDLLETLRTTNINIPSLVVLDVKAGNAVTWRGKRGP